MRSLILLLVLMAVSYAAESNLSVLTYNVLADPVHKELRINAINSIIQKENPDIVCLQEVAPWVLIELQKNGFFEAYKVSVHQDRPLSPRGLLVAIRKDFGELGTYSFGPIGGRQGRHYLIQQIRHQKIGTLTVATTHLESFLEDSEIRKQQLDLIFSKLGDFEKVIFAADFNYGDDAIIEPKAIPQGYQDTWKLVNPKDPGFTWNIERSEMARRGSFPNEKSRRIDHIYAKGHSKVSECRIVGDNPIQGSIFPSDHFGLMCLIVVPNDQTAPDSSTGHAAETGDHH